MASIKLEDCKLITAKEYLELKNPIFEGQTGVNKDGYYYMVWSDNGVMYKTYNKI